MYRSGDDGDPKARYAIRLLKYLKSVAPGGHLIIGGYLDAWLLILQCRMRSAICIHWDRREEGKKIPYVIRCGTFMDDFSIGSGSIKGEQRAVKSIGQVDDKESALADKRNDRNYQAVAD